MEMYMTMSYGGSGGSALYYVLKKRKEAAERAKYGNADDDNDNYCCAGISWSPKDAVKGVKYPQTVVDETFTCDGTDAAHHYFHRAPDTIRKPHHHKVTHSCTCSTVSKDFAH